MVSAAFLVSSLLVIVIPGPDLALITQLVVVRGRLRPAVAAAAGMVTAGAVHAGLGALGLAVLLATRPALFTAVRWAGAVVLLGMAALALRAALRPVPPAAVQPPLPDRRAFVQGARCTGANPKVGLFLMAFLPQFVPPGVNPAAGVAVLAAIYLSLVLVWLLTWMALVGLLSRFVRSPAVARGANVCTAIVFTVFAGGLLLSG